MPASRLGTAVEYWAHWDMTRDRGSGPLFRRSIQAISQATLYGLRGADPGMAGTGAGVASETPTPSGGVDRPAGVGAGVGGDRDYCHGHCGEYPDQLVGGAD